MLGTSMVKIMDKYEFVVDIGVGSFGLAKLMRDKETKELVAVKLLERGPKVNVNVAREIINHRSIRHPNVVRFKEVLLTPTHLLIVMEYAAGGQLYDRVMTAGRFSEAEARYFFQQLISGVSYCHSMQISHGDLKLANTLLDGSPAPRVKICDFGYSLSSMLHSKPKSITGTLPYIAPEVLSGREYDGKLADVWSCGVTLYVMLVGAYPFANEKESENIETTTQRILGVKYKIPAYIKISEECRHLLSRIFVSSAMRRITIREIKNHPWFLRNLPRELSDAAQAKYFSRTNTTISLQSVEDIMKIVEEARNLAIYPPSVSNSTGRLILGNEESDDDQEEVEKEEAEEEDEYDKKVKEVNISEGLSVSGVVRLPERSLVVNQFHSNYTDPSMFGLCLAERSTSTNHIDSYNLDSAASQSVTFVDKDKNSKPLDSSMYVRLAERSVESNTSNSYHSEHSYPSICNVRSAEKSIKPNVSDTESWEKVSSFNPSISDVRKAEKSLVLKQLRSSQNQSAFKLHDTSLRRGSLDSEDVDSEYSAKIENLDLSISDVRSAEKSVVSGSHFDWRGWTGKARPE